MTDTIKVSEHLGTLYGVLCRATTVERRADLRKLAEAGLRMVMGEGAEAKVAEVLEGSPIVGMGGNQIRAKGMKGLIQNLSEVALANMALADPKLVELMVLALHAPGPQGVASDRSKTGYVFGQHREHLSLADAKTRALRVGTAVDAYEEETKHETKETTDMVDQDAKLAAMMDGMPLRHIFRTAVELRDYKGASLVQIADKIEAVWATGRGGSVAMFIRQASAEEADASADQDWSEMATHDMRVMFSELGAMLHDEREPEAAAPVAGWMNPDDKIKGFIDLALKDTGMTFDGIVAQVRSHEAKAQELAKELADARAMSHALPVMVSEASGEGEGEVPGGKMGWVDAATVFGLKRGKDSFAFKVPVWEWDHAHPHVPVLDEGYVFRPHELMEVLIGLIQNEPTYLVGHTGTGKTTMVEQVCARMGWPVFRVNFDSEITRLDLIGRDTLVQEEGVTVSRFVDGVIPTYMQLAYVMIFDEFDFIRPDVAYVMQRVLENDRLVLTEDGGRVVKPHAMSRIVATGNTKGQGDEHGMYQGARPQSLALLDRFTNWIEFDYLPAEDRLALIRAAAPKLTDADAQMIGRYVTEHLQAFMDSKVIQPLSPRGYKALARRVEAMLGMFPKAQRSKAIERAFESAVLAKANVQDGVVLRGIVNRVIR